MQLVYYNYLNAGPGRQATLILSQRTNFRLFQTERFGTHHFKCDENGRKFSKGSGNTVGKGEIAHHKQFLFSHSVFKKLYCRYVKTGACLGKGEQNSIELKLYQITPN